MPFSFGERKNISSFLSNFAELKYVALLINQIDILDDIL
jgi:hypothetical protein